MNRTKRIVAVASSTLCVLAIAVAWITIRDENTESEADSGSSVKGVVASPPTELAYVGPLSDPSKSTLGTEPSEAPQPLKLFATIRGRNAREGAARMGAYSENPQTYMAGALLGSGARLFEIYDRYVVLERDGKRQKVFIEGSGMKPEAGDLHIVGASGEPKTQPLAGSEERKVPELTDYIRPSAVYELDRLKGYRVFAGKRSHVFSQMGLRDGDVITSMNGAIDDIVSGMAALAQLTKGGAMTITVDRDGSNQTLYLDGAHIVADASNMNQTVAAAPPL